MTTIVKKILLFFFVALMGMAVTRSYAADAFAGVTVTGLNFDGSFGSVLFVKVNRNPTIAGCHTDANWNFAITTDSTANPAGKYMFAILLAAQSSGQPVDIFGLNTCPGFPNIQGIQRVSLSR